MSKTAPESVRELIKKVNALAEQGIAGEQVAAAEMLDKLLKKHGLTLEDVLGTKLIWASITFRTAMENKLIINTMVAVVGHSKIRNWTAKGRYHFEVTQAEAFDVKAAYAFYKKLWHDSINDLCTAFIHKHRLFPKSEDDNMDTTPMPIEQVERLQAMMGGLKGGTWRRQLE